MNQQGLVSVIIPTYKRPELLEETLLSVMNQSYKNWECIIVIDEEDEKTTELLRRFQSIDNRFRFYLRPANIKKGACSCRNLGFLKSSGKYVQWLDDDDLLSVEKLERQVKFMENSTSDNIFVSCDWDYFWPGKSYSPIRIIEGDFLLPKTFFTQIRSRQSFLPPHTYLTPRKLILASGLWNTDLLINQDAEFFTRILINSEKVYHVEHCHVLYRSHDSGRVSERDGEVTHHSLIYSLRLIHSHLLSKDIHCTAYFHWKLLKLVIHSWENSAQVFKKHYHFFKEIGIDLDFIWFYKGKYAVYRRVFPIYKKGYKKFIN